MTSTEVKDFEFNADIVIRGLVAQRLGIDVAIPLHHPPPNKA